jgi:hypothetical protein
MARVETLSAPALALAAMAAEFVSEPEMWPVFVAWANAQPGRPLPEAGREACRGLSVELGVAMVTRMVG